MSSICSMKVNTKASEYDIIHVRTIFVPTNANSMRSKKNTCIIFMNIALPGTSRNFVSDCIRFSVLYVK